MFLVLVEDRTCANPMLLVQPIPADVYLPIVVFRIFPSPKIVLVTGEKATHHEFP
jgi:hypothetical protein